MPWSNWTSTPEAHARASGRRWYNKRRQDHAKARRQEVERLLQRWGPSAAAKAKMARLLGVSLRTITRDVHALQERPPLPVICPTCHLPSRLDVDPSSLTDDPAELAAMEQAMARLIGAEDPETRPPRRPRSPPARLTRLQGDDRADPRAPLLLRGGDPGAWGQSGGVEPISAP
jgi:hypothetical protein